MKREQQLDQVDRLTRPMELRFAAAYRRFIARLRPTIVANVRAGRAPDAAGSKDKLPRAFASLYRRDITAGRVQADRQIPKKPARKHLPGDHDQQSHAGGGGGEVGGGGARREGGTDWAWAREQHAQRIAADPEAYARAREEHEATRLGRDVATMRGGDMNRELDKLDRESAKINDRLLAAGRGNEKPSERRDKLDILSIEYRNNQDRLAQLRAEVEARYGPNAPRRLPPRVGSKPRKEFKARSRMSDLEEGASREVGVAGTRRLPYATGVTFDVGDLIDASLERLGGTLDTLDDRLEAVLSDAPDDATDDELADLMEAELDAFEDNGKIEDIAETEVFGSVNGGRAQAFEENEVEWGEWGTMQDNRVRETHVDLGESGVHPVGFNYAKLVGFGETLLRWPHDVECQEAALVINCRCALLYAEAPANAEEIYDEEMGDLGEEEKGLLVAKHLPGEHDQQSHAGDGGGKGDEGGGGTVAGTAGSSGGSSADRIAGATARANTQIRMPEADYDKASEARTEEENRIDNEQAEHSVVLTAAVAAHADAQQAADAASAIGNRPEATDADKQAAYEARRALGEAVIGKNNALVKQESFDAQRNELNASMGADYWATHYEKNPDEFQTTMDELRGSWRHIGGMTDKVDPIAFRFASQTAFGLDQGVAFDKKADRLIDRAEYAAQEGAMTQWAGAMRNEYEDTQEELKADVEWNGGDNADQTDNYDVWTESDTYMEAYSNAKDSAFGDLKQDELEELVDNGPGEAKAYEWASENLDKLEEHGDDAEPTMQGLVFPDTGSDENPSTVEGSLDKLREAGITGDYDPNQRVIEEDGQPIREAPSDEELKGVADLKALGETVDSRREEAAAMSGKAADLDAVASKEWGDNWKNALWQGKLDDQMTKPQREELRATKDEIDKLNRDASAATKDAQYLANRSESMAIRIMEQTGKWPDGKTTEEKQNELDAEIDTFVEKWGKLAYAKEDPKGYLMDEFSQNFEYDDSADFQDWQGSSGSGSSGEPMTISPNDWPLEMTRNMDADESGYVANFSESWAFGKEQRMFGSTTMTRKIDKEKVLVFQGAKHWRAVGMGLTEAEFIVLSDRPWWVRQKARDEERARQQEEAQIANKSGRREKRRDAGDVLLPGKRGGHRGAESDDGGREGERWRDSGGPVHREGGPEATRGGAGAGARKDAHEKGDVSKHLPGQHDQQDHAGGGGGREKPKISDDVRGAHHGQVDGTLRATDAEGKVTGYLDYSVFEGRALIQMVEVAETSRRQGIGRALVDRLREEHPEIEWGMMTGEGAALRESIDPGWEKREREQVATRAREHASDRAEYERLREGFKPTTDPKNDNDKIQQALDDLDEKYGGDIERDLRPTKAMSRERLALAEVKAWLLADPFRKHLAGEHDQQSHAGGGDSEEPGTKPNVSIRMHEGASERIGQTLGYDPSKVAGVLGLGEAGMAMSGWIYEKEGGLVVAKLRGDGLEVVRTIDAQEGVINNDGFHLDKRHQGKGIGTRILAAQVEEASAKGYTALKTHAVGAAGEVENGYYTWPRLGYDGPIPSDHPFRERASNTQHAKVKRVSDLMKTEEGRDAWKKWGSNIELTFDLEEGSQSREVLAAYMAQRKKN